MCSSRYSCGFYPRLDLGLHIDGTKRGRGLGDDDQVASHFDVEVNLNVGITHRLLLQEGAPIEKASRPQKKEAPHRGTNTELPRSLVDAGLGEPMRS